ncbi:pilus assembly protein PilU [Eikenella longinqua]|uniref:Pilus assembly protein PilU n=2 Tax=Eikenella TaxID=538 RepID=A0A1A9RZH1_9NEIS|nr:pilus assembly protein PilU [Eikenella longinqua]
MSNDQHKQNLAELLSEMANSDNLPPEPTPVSAAITPEGDLSDIESQFAIPQIQDDSLSPQAIDIPSLPDMPDPQFAQPEIVAQAVPPAQPQPQAKPAQPLRSRFAQVAQGQMQVTPSQPQPAPAQAQPAPAPQQPAQAAPQPQARPAAAVPNHPPLHAAPAQPVGHGPNQHLTRERAKLHPLLEKMADESLKRNASDIFISSNFPPSFKIDGTLVPVPVKPLTEEEAAQIVYSTFNDEQKAKFPVEWELNYSLQSQNGIRFRVNAYHEQGRIGLVMRRITTNILTVDDLRLPQVLKELSMRKRGLIILAGPTGSGKSTSQAAMLDWRNKHSAGHIVTIEDPIEYIHSPIKSIITQREVGLDTHSWGAAVQSAMRQAPDVVCVGEVRNEHSMEYALQLAQTGHLCFFTIHATNASQTVERIMNLYPEERHQQILMDLALNLVAIIGQRLVLKKGGKGRNAIIDLLINTPAMQDHVFKNELLEARELMERAEDDGMQTFDQDLFRLYINGEIDYDEALRQAESANDLRLRIKLYEEGRESTHIFERVNDLNLM